MAKALAQAGKTDQARSVTDQALATAKAIPDEQYRALALADVASALAQADH